MYGNTALMSALNLLRKLENERGDENTSMITLLLTPHNKI